MTSLNYMNLSKLKEDLYNDVQGKLISIYQEFVEIDRMVNDQINEQLVKI